MSNCSVECLHTRIPHDLDFYGTPNIRVMVKKGHYIEGGTQLYVLNKLLSKESFI